MSDEGGKRALEVEGREDFEGGVREKTVVK